MTVPVTYDLDFSGLYLDLQARAESRLLSQFQNYPVLKLILSAVISEVEELQHAIADIIKLRTLSQSSGEVLNGIGRIVGQPNALWSTVVSTINQESGEVIQQQDGQDISTQEFEQTSTGLNLDEYKTLVLLKIACNFCKYGSIPEITAAIYQATGLVVLIQRTGPMAVDIMVAPDTNTTLLGYLTRSSDSLAVEGRFLLPLPATLQVAVAFNKDFLQEDGQEIFTQSGQQISTENIPKGV